MVGYIDNPEKTAEVMQGGYYRTGDTAARDADGYLTFVGRADDVFKASDYRISPFELESVMIEHEAVLEAAVVPTPDPVRLAVPKAYVLLAPGYEPSREVAISLAPRPAGLMAGYQDDPNLNEFVTRGGYYRTGDVASRDADGYITYVRRADDVFKSSDYQSDRI